MASTPNTSYTRKPAEERRREILDAAATIAPDDGLEKITLRAVADSLGVRPGLISHYFPVAESLVTDAFALAAALERERFFPDVGTSMEQLAHFFRHIESGASLPLARLWLNARHLSRFVPSLAAVLEEQDAMDRARLSAIIADGIHQAAFVANDAEGAATRILLAVDGLGSYANASDDIESSLRHLPAEAAEVVLGLTPRPSASRSAKAAGCSWCPGARRRRCRARR